MTEQHLRPRRSVLYMPGSNRRAMDKAHGLAADALILDLEDAVAPSHKEEARQLVCEQVAAGDYGYREVIVRVNGEGTPWHEQDLAAAAAVGPSAILLPKVEDAEMVSRCRGRLHAQNRPGLWVMIETPAGVANVDAIAATPGVEVLVMGTADLGKALRVRASPSRWELFYALSRTVLAARRWGRDALDGVSPDLEDMVAFETAARQGADLGFDGKTLIHPSQIEIANRAFGPSPEEIERARRVVATWDEAEASGRGVAVLDGRMIEKLHADEARRTLAFAEAIAARHGQT